MMVGTAYQKGWLPLDEKSFVAAIELNGVGVKMNLTAFNWGRRLAVDPVSVFRAANLLEAEPESLDEMVERRAEFLSAYQDAAYAQRYRDRIAQVRKVAERVPGGFEVIEAAAKSLFKLMAYKDEYEVARLYTETGFEKALAEQFEGDFKLHFHLAPPIFSPRDKTTGHLRKRRFGSWMMPAFRILAKAKRLRGTSFDPFGYTAERRMERALIGEYEQLLQRLSAKLTAENADAIAKLAALPMTIRGYGHVKDAAVDAYRVRVSEDLEKLERLAATSPSPAAVVAV
jgi:indolepyruvate ferredoxin oxidoreductase